ncbi:MAG TPA: type II toxin-antitoxin system VapC family toxin [Pseudolysinimonas sp.]|nr:type II toxin-antitoxin system VapC family toxin [Pseudolysinimonas sp.]
MIVDSSAVIAILANEPEAAAFSGALQTARRVAMAAPTLVELYVVADRARDPRARSALDDLLRTIGPEVEAFTAEHAAIARQAHRNFGRGSGHPARLNLGDCFSYALAKATGEPLLYKGEDFGHTDIRSALE